jgi:hypothetical protein
MNVCYIHPFYTLLTSIASILFFTVCSSAQPPESTADKHPEMILFDGTNLDNWSKTDYAGKGEIFIDENQTLVMEMGATLSGIHWTGDDLPVENYEISLQARRTLGSDFFCGLTFPYKDAHATLILGGWGGSLIGISSIDDFDASENETGDAYIFEEKEWYDIRLLVMETKLRVFINGETVIDADVDGKKVAMRVGEIEMSVPLGITTYGTTGEFKNIVLRKNL